VLTYVVERGVCSAIGLVAVANCRQDQSDWPRVTDRFNALHALTYATRTAFDDLGYTEQTNAEAA
jgi:hypothetical protein